MKSFFCGVPCTTPNKWELVQFAIPGDTVSPAGAKLRRSVVPQLASLTLLADFYNEHHSCCWSRTLLDTHLGQSAEAVAAFAAVEEREEKVTGGDIPVSLSSLCDRCSSHSRSSSVSSIGSRDHHHDNSLVGVFDGEERRTDEEGSGDGTMQYMRHIVSVARQLALAQRERLPRAPMARRLVFDGAAVPPVLRCSHDGNGPVFTLSGRFVLHHRSLRDRHDSPLEEKEEEQRAIQLARDVFPLFLVMAPSDACAAFVDGETGVAAKAAPWLAQPQVLALETVAWKAVAATSSSDQVGRAMNHCQDEDDDGVWCATYSAFAWVCHPLGNEAAQTRNTSRSAARKPHSSSRKRTREALETITPRSDLPPLQLAFHLYATAFTSKAAKEHVLAELKSSHLYSPRVTNTVRFGFQGTAKVVAEVAEEQLSAARARRPRQLMRLLDATLSFAAGTGDTAFHTKDGVVVESASGSSTSHHEATASDQFPVMKDEGQASTPQSSQPTREVPCVTTVLLATLQTAHPIAREVCSLPKSTNLVSVLRKMGDSDCAAASFRPHGGVGGCCLSSSKEGWPLRVTSSPHSRAAKVTKLTPLHTLDDLADALENGQR